MDDSFVNLGEEVILTLLWQSGEDIGKSFFFQGEIFISPCPFHNE